MHLRVLTYNIHKGIGSDRRFDLDRIITILKESHADVLCLQEVDRDVPRSGKQDLARVIAEELGMDFAFAANVRLKRGSYGNATISRYPISESWNFDLTWRIKKKRGCLITLHRSREGRNFAIYNAHLGLAAFERNWQIHRLLTSGLHKELRAYPSIILGDTNDSRHRLTALLEVGGYTDSCRTKRKRTNFTFPAYAPVVRIDKVFYDDSWKPLRHYVIHSRLSRIASDHRPVVVDLELQKAR